MLPRLTIDQQFPHRYDSFVLLLTIVCTEKDRYARCIIMQRNCVDMAIVYNVWRSRIVCRWDRLSLICSSSRAANDSTSYLQEILCH